MGPGRPSVGSDRESDLDLLQATDKGAGADGDRLAKTTYIQRMNTVGGRAPAGACTPGTTISVPYSADDYFYMSSKD